MMPSTDHPHDYLLQNYADNPDSVPPETADHIQSCTQCGNTVSFHQKLGKALTRHQRSVLQFRARMRIEAEDAKRVLGPLVDDPYEFVRENVARSRRYRFGGAVAYLCEASQRWCDNKPDWAFQLAQTAVTIAEALPDKEYPSAIVNTFRGLAWKEIGKVHWYRGEIRPGFSAADHAEAAYKQSPDPGAGLPSVKVLRALLFWKQKRHEEALRQITSASADYESRDEPIKLIEAKEIEAAILHRLGRVDIAKAAYLRAFAKADEINNVEMKARSAKNLAVTSHEAGDLSTATEYAALASRLFEELGHSLTVVRSRWTMACIWLTAGKFEPAESLLRDCIADLLSRGALDDAADARLDLAEALLMLSRFDEVDLICTELIAFYREREILPNALTALSFLKESSAQRRLQRRDIQHVHRYLKSLKDDPRLAFLPLPLQN